MPKLTETQKNFRREMGIPLEDNISNSNNSTFSYRHSNDATFRPMKVLWVFFILFYVLSLFTGFIVDNSLGMTIMAYIEWPIVFWLYFLPTILGNKRTNMWTIFWLNLLTGWTFIGWVITLIMSLSYDRDKRLESIEKTIDKLNKRD